MGCISVVVMNIELDNFLLFQDFHLNLSYPKRPVNSTIPDEHISDRPNFRYKKLVILMGANATGKTALSRVLMGIFNFISRKEYISIVPYIEDPMKNASFVIDFAFTEHILYRISCTIAAQGNKSPNYKSADISVTVLSEEIQKTDSYERCLARLLAKEAPLFDNYIQALEAVPHLTWKFEDPFGAGGKQRAVEPVAPGLYTIILEKTLQALDPRIRQVQRVPNTDDTFLIQFENHTAVIKDGQVMDPETLSSGTAEGIGIANLLTALRLQAMDFFFCDEKFSHVHSDSEKAFLSLMIELMRNDQQLIITTHNTDILDMDLPLHSFAFLRRDLSDPNSVQCVFASEYLKKNTASLKNAVENDLFSAAPDTDRISAIGDCIREVFHET